MVAELPVDTSTPSVARMYNYALGGKDNFEVDRQAVTAAESLAPGAVALAVENRALLIRMTRFLVTRAGVDQFLDLGSGLPTAENVHQVAQRTEPRARVVYSDNDPSVAAHGRALLDDDDRTTFALADLTDPDQVLGNETVRRHLDWQRPIALYQLATLHHQPDSVDLPALMRTYVDALPAGSFVAFSHFHDPGGRAGEQVERIRRSMLDHGTDADHFRSRDQIEGMLAGLDLVEPGLVPAKDWWPDGPHLQEPQPVQHCILGAVGHKR